MKNFQIYSSFKIIVNLKYETEKYICTKNNNLDKFKKKWTI